MKKFLGVCAAGLMLLGLSAPAHASYSSGDLIQVVIDTTTNQEMKTDLGSITPWETAGDTYTTTLGTTNYHSGDSLLVAYFAGTYVSGSTSKTSAIWTSGIQSGTETVSSVPVNSGAGLLQAAATIAYSTGANGSVGASTWVASNNTKSYFYLMDGNSTGTAGFFKNFYQSADGDAALAIGSNALQGMYNWASPTTLNSGDALGASFNLTSVLNSNGAITVTSAAVPAATTPIPPSALLLGSGLLGLVGIRRRKVLGL